MTSKQLECFVEVAESLNFTAASSALFLSQPTVTRQIRLLEEELGVQLFLRTKKSVSLTPAGESFFIDAKEILSRILIAKNKASHNSEAYTAKIAIGYSGVILEYSLIPHILEEFTHSYPDVYVFLKQLHYKEIRGHLEDKKMDMVFTYSKDSLRQRDCRFLPLIRADYYVLIPYSHPFTRLPYITLENLKTENIILPEVSNCPKEAQSLISYLAAALPASQIHYCDSPQTAVILAKGSLGLTIMPEFDMQTDNKIIAKKLHTEHFLEYGIAYMQNNAIQKYLDKIIQSTESIDLHYSV